MFAASLVCALAASVSCRAAEPRAGGSMLSDLTPADLKCGGSVSPSSCYGGKRREVLGYDCARAWRDCGEAIPDGSLQFLADPGHTGVEERAGGSNSVTLGLAHRKRQRAFGVMRVVRPQPGQDHPRSDGELGDWFYLSQGVGTAPLEVVGVAGEGEAFLLLNLRGTPVRLDLTRVMDAQLPQCRSGVLVYDPFMAPAAIVDAARACANAPRNGMAAERQPARVAGGDRIGQLGRMCMVEFFRRWRREIDLAMVEGVHGRDRLRRADAIFTIIAVAPALLLALLGKGGWAEWGWLTRAAGIAAGAWFLLVLVAFLHAFGSAYRKAERLADAEAADGARSPKEPRMRLEAEGRRAALNPSEAQIRKAVLGLRSGGPSSFAILTDAAGDYVQVGGGGDACVLERRDGAGGRHYRAYRRGAGEGAGVTLEFGGGAMALAPDEQFDAETALDVFLAFFDGSDMPAEVLWRRSRRSEGRG